MKDTQLLSEGETMKFLKTRCYNGGNKHKFKPRYKEIDNKDIYEIGFQDGNLKDIRKILYYNQYVCDVCVWCGKITKEKR